MAKQINKKLYVYSVLKNSQPGNLTARIDFSPNKPLSAPDRISHFVEYRWNFHPGVP